MYFDIKPIPEFPNYSVTVDGRIINMDSGREMIFSPTLQGEMTVGLVKDRIQYRRSVKVIVARAFVDGESLLFDTPILLDLDRRNLDSANIRWRPRWFAWRYTRQFTQPFPDWFFNGPVFDLTNQMHYPTIYQACQANGLLCRDLREALLNGTHIFPTGDFYKYI